MEKETLLAVSGRTGSDNRTGNSYYEKTVDSYAPSNDEQLNFWKTSLSGYEYLNLPTDRQRPIKADKSSICIFFNIDEETSSLLGITSRELDVSLEGLLFSGFYLMLASFSNQKDIVVGTMTAAGKKQNNPLALRTFIDPQQSVLDFIRQTEQTLVNAQRHSSLPFESILSAIGEDVEPFRHPVFQAMLALVDISKPHNSYVNSGCDLVVLMDENEENICGRFYYSPALFDESSIVSFIDTFKCILEQIAAVNNTLQNDTKIKELSYLPEEAYERSIKTWNATATPYPCDKTIHQLFEEQVTETPHNPAVIFEGTTISYAELNRRANRLAAWLRQECGIRPDDLVVLCLDRSEEMPEAVLGVLKAGAAYVPVDPTYPEDRMRFVLEDTNATVVLTQSLHSEKIPIIGRELSCVNLDDPSFREMLEGFSDVNPVPVATPLNLAYVIYTSGTTGKPKGAMLQHQGIVNRIVWMNNQYPLKETDRILQKTPYVFDVSVWELFWAHWYGAAIVYACPGGQKDNAYLASCIEKEQITVIHFVPSMLGVFEEALENDPELRQQAGSLRYLFCSGEALPLTMVRKAHELLPETEIHNLYGPTEASVDVLYYDCNDRKISTVPIGRPIANTSMYILDEFLRPLPIGGIGELYIGGDGVARGYLNRPELTHERFIFNPFQSDEEQKQLRNARLYKTGDLARYLPDGNIEYLGRNDFQVEEFRGFRIELGEIEARISEYPGIRQAVVLPIEKSGSTYLAVYYVAEATIEKEHILASLAAQLPEYMVPTAWVRLDNLPKTINGKLDRRSLPEPDFNNNQVYRAPQNFTQEVLCEMYGSVLKLDAATIGVDDNFFHLGGSSILALRLLSMINKHFNSKMSIADIFMAKTISELDAKLSDTKKQYTGVVKLNEVTGAENLFMVHPGNAGCEVYAPLAKRLEGSFNCYGVDSYNLYHTDMISDLPELARLYLKQIETIQQNGNGPYVLLGWSLGGLLALEIATILESRGVKDIRLFLLDTILSDELLDVLSTGLQQEELQHVVNQIGNIFEHAQQSSRYLDAQIKLSQQKPSHGLRYTKVTLFKAMRPDNIFKSESAMLSKTHVLTLKSNNVERCLEYPNKQLQVLELENADHYDLLKEEDILASRILEHMPVQQETKTQKIRPEAWLILFLLTLIWGSSFILIKKGLDGFSPMQVGSLRICFAGLVMLPVSLRHLRKVPRKALFYSVLFGLLNAGLPAFLFPIAETQVDSSTAGILNGLTPIFTLITGLLFFGIPFNIFKLIGVVVGFLGASMLILFREGFDGPIHIRDSQVFFSMLLVFATCLYGFAGNVMKRHLDNVQGPVIASFAFGSFAIPSAIYLAFSDFGYRLTNVDAAPGSLVFIAVLGVFGSAIAVMLQSRLAKLSNALFVSFVTYLIPFVAIAWGMADDEKIGIIPFVSLAVILLAIYISRMKPLRSTR